MEINTTSLLPYVLDLLSRQPDLCTSIDAICDQVQDVVMDEVISPFGTLKRAVEFSIELGMNLGLLLLSDKRVRIPINFNAKSDKNQTRITKPKNTLWQEQNRHVIKRLTKTSKNPRSVVIKQKAKGKPCPRGRPAANAKSLAGCLNASKVRRSTALATVKLGSAKKRNIGLHKTIGRTSCSSHTTETRSRRY